MQVPDSFTESLLLRQQRLVGSQCFNSSDCDLPNGQYCENGICICADGMVLDSNICVSQPGWYRQLI